MTLYEIKQRDNFNQGRFFYEKQVLLRVCKSVGAKLLLKTPAGSKEISFNEIRDSFKYKATALFLYFDNEDDFNSSHGKKIILKLPKFKRFCNRVFVVVACDGDQPLTFYSLLSDGKLKRYSYMYQIETPEDVRNFWNTSLHIYHTDGKINSGREYFEENVFSNLHYQLGDKLQMLDFDAIQFDDGFLFESGKGAWLYSEIAWP